MFFRCHAKHIALSVGIAVLGAWGAASAAAPYEHVLILSIDGLREADLSDPATAAYLPSITAFENSAIHYSNAHSVVPSDSVPISLSYFTGAGPKTTGVYYEDSYDRSLYAPGAFIGGPPGTLVALRENLDNNANILSGGGNSDASSISPFNLPQRKVGADGPRHPEVEQREGAPHRGDVDGLPVAVQDQDRRMREHV